MRPFPSRRGPAGKKYPRKRHGSRSAAGACFVDKARTKQEARIHTKFLQSGSVSFRIGGNGGRPCLLVAKRQRCMVLAPLGCVSAGWLPEDVVMKPRVNSHNHRIPVDENSNTIYQWKSRARNLDELNPCLSQKQFCVKDSENSFGTYQTNGWLA
jgi:hypothetical protein